MVTSRLQKRQKRRHRASAKDTSQQQIQEASKGLVLWAKVSTILSVGQELARVGQAWVPTQWGCWAQMEPKGQNVDRTYH